MPPGRPSPKALSGFYIVAAGATFMAMLVIMVMNISTPFEFSRDRINELLSHGWKYTVAYRFGLLLLVTSIAAIPLLWTLKNVLKPIRICLTLPPSQNDLVLLEKARQRLINLPFIMVPVNLGLWAVIPSVLFFALFYTNMMDFSTAMTFGIRSVMVGMMSSAILFFNLEAHARRTLVPYFFSGGRLTEVDRTQRIPIKRRIRAFYRLGSLIPLIHIVLTLFVLYLQVDDNPMSTREYARSVLFFSLVVLSIFFLGSGVLTQLITRSISDPVNDMLFAVNTVKKGDYSVRTQVVSNDEIGVLGDAFNQAIQGLEERKQLRDAFGRYVDPRIRDEILSGRIPLDGEYKSVTVMFADLRNFTPLTATHDPKSVVKLLNAYFKTMEAAITSNKGLILQFLGDEIYAVFGAPVSDDLHPSHAVNAAFDMEKRLADLNRELESKGLPQLSHGIGIHTGRVLAANIGSPDRLSYLLVGDTVNLAARLQKKTRDINVNMIISNHTLARIDDKPEALGLIAHPAPVKVKGLDEPVDIFTSMT